ncbi:hypothetical protein [Haloferula sargassicola]|uniref:Uncharacterized protein n=1 Tax=Haloferula sargassicola TaxID=490096 RepID=A0ABP9ULP9_9BACT
MKYLVRKIAGSELAHLEDKLNETRTRPEFAGFNLVSSFLSPDDSKLVVIFGKPDDSPAAPESPDPVG